MGNMGFSKQNIWVNYGSLMGFTVENMGEIVVNLSLKFKLKEKMEHKNN